MKTSIGVITSVLALLSTPAMAATGGDRNTAVWIALGAVFLGALTTVGGALLASAAKKKKKDADRT